jgi:hypothetical protein
MNPTQGTELRINGVAVSWSSVWVHMQDSEKRKKPAYPYIAIAPIEYAKQIFDPHRTRAESVNWSKFVTPLIDEFGTFIVGAYFDQMASLSTSKVEGRGYEWVIATVDDIIEREHSIHMIGRAVKFDSDKY